jgi:bis(5'-nucleosidyl)-tetraphosphatase
MLQKDFAAGVVIFRIDEDGSRSYLVIKNHAGHWELPKGHSEPGEEWIQTALREATEETGIDDIELIPDFSRQTRYVFRDRKRGIIQKVVCFALGRTKSESVRLSYEHTDFLFLPIEQAIARLTHAATRAVLHDAEVFLNPVPSPGVPREGVACRKSL